MATAPNPSPSNNLKFRVNVPETVALKFADGMPVSSRYSGEQVMFTLTDDRRMYVDPYVADRIRAAGIRANEAFTITKTERQVGNRRVVDFEVETSAPSAKTTAPVSSRDHQQVTQSTTHATNTRPEGAQLLHDCGVQAIQILRSWADQAKNAGIVADFNGEDVRTMAATLFINAHGGRA